MNMALTPPSVARGEQVVLVAELERSVLDGVPQGVPLVDQLAHLRQRLQTLMQHEMRA